jgi:hypothetical protein
MTEKESTPKKKTPNVYKPSLPDGDPLAYDEFGDPLTGTPRRKRERSR